MTQVWTSSWAAVDAPATNTTVTGTAALTSALAGLDPASLWANFLHGATYFLPIYLTTFIVGGFWLLAKAWPVLLEAQRTRRVADSGPYARIRHPQYVAFVLVMFGFLLQWPTLITLIMFPVLLIVYARLARREELDAIEAFGDAYRSYRDRTPAFIPRLR